MMDAFNSPGGSTMMTPSPSSNPVSAHFSAVRAADAAAGFPALLPLTEPAGMFHAVEVPVPSDAGR